MGWQWRVAQIRASCPSLTSLTADARCLDDLAALASSRYRALRTLHLFASLYSRVSAPPPGVFALPSLTELSLIGLDFPLLEETSAPVTLSPSLTTLSLDQSLLPPPIKAHLYAQAAANRHHLSRHRNAWLEFVVTLLHCRAKSAARRPEARASLLTLPLELLERVLCGNSAVHLAVLHFLLTNLDDVIARVHRRRGSLRIAVTSTPTEVRVQWPSTPRWCTFNSYATICSCMSLSIIPIYANRV